MTRSIQTPRQARDALDAVQVASSEPLARLAAMCAEVEQDARLGAVGEHPDRDRHTAEELLKAYLGADRALTQCQHVRQHVVTVSQLALSRRPSVVELSVGWMRQVIDNRRPLLAAAADLGRHECLRIDLLAAAAASRIPDTVWAEVEAGIAGAVATGPDGEHDRAVAWLDAVRALREMREVGDSDTATMTASAAARLRAAQSAYDELATAGHPGGDAA